MSDHSPDATAWWDHVGARRDRDGTVRQNSGGITRIDPTEIQYELGKRPA